MCYLVGRLHDLLEAPLPDLLVWPRVSDLQTLQLILQGPPVSVTVPLGFVIPTVIEKIMCRYGHRNLDIYLSIYLSIYLFLPRERTFSMKVTMGLLWTAGLLAMSTLRKGFQPMLTDWNSPNQMDLPPGRSTDRPGILLSGKKLRPSVSHFSLAIWDRMMFMIWVSAFTFSSPMAPETL